jgi:tetratricopeptide (TPR) repeat protein
MNSEPILRWTGCLLKAAGPRSSSCPCLAFLAVLALAAGLTIASVRLAAGGPDPDADKKRAEEEMKRAEENYRKARAAIDKILAELDKLPVKQDSATTELRRKLLEQALKYYQEMVKAVPKNASDRHEAARAHQKLLDIQAMLGQTDKAMAAYRQAIAMLEKLVRESPNQPAYARDLAVAQVRLGDLFVKTGKLADAEKSYE